MKLPKNTHPRGDAASSQGSDAASKKARKQATTGQSKLGHILDQEHLRDRILRDVAMRGESLDRFAESHPDAARHAVGFAQHVQQTKLADLLFAAHESFQSPHPTQPQKPPNLAFSSEETMAVDAFLRRRVDLQRPLHEANRLRNEGQVDASLTLYATILADHPDWARAHLEMGLTLMHSKNVRNHLNFVELDRMSADACRLHPNDENICLLRAEVIMRIVTSESPVFPRQVLELLARVSTLRGGQPRPPAATNPSSADLLGPLKQSRLSQDFAPYDLLERLRDPYPEHFVQRLRAEAILLLGQREAAREAFLHVCSLEKRDLYAIAQVGQLSWSIGDLPSANIFLRKAVGLQPGDLQASSTYAAYLYEGGKFEEARLLLAQVPAQNLSLQDARAHTIAVALCLIAEKKFDAALRHLPPIGRNSPMQDRIGKLRAVHTHLALLKKRKVDGPKLVKWFAKSSWKFSTPQMQYVCGLLQVRQGELEEGVGYLSQALNTVDALKSQGEVLKIDELAFSSHLPLVEALLGLEQKDQAVSVLQRALELWPWRNDYRTRLVQLRGQ